MIKVFKNIKPYYIAIIIDIVISYVFLRMMGYENINIMYQTIFGGTPLYIAMLKGLFIMNLSLLQLINIDYITFFIDNSDSLSIRYGSRDNFLKALLKGNFVITGVFIILIYIIWLPMEIVFNSNVGFNPINIEMLIMIGRVYLFCIIIVLLQILLLLKTTKVNTYMILTSISIILAFMSYYSFKLGVLPQLHSGYSNWINIIINILFIIFLIIIIVIV
ncbi:hypothetical protein [Tissierella creatinophila]|uniref:ABC-2 family transporter protein n=1 Tax=Tissierella creatinophila DSM 6911 TaxID=1123403 RepID=A0A1U7M4H1_TISCR|nr:hypothetical protein [Tissierella creatinophila]OLS02212.1 hypothetical protein TICRE_18160 [Tissierella creatinophila DSM 6911]